MEKPLRFKRSKFKVHLLGMNCSVTHYDESEHIESVTCPFCLQKLSNDFYKKEHTKEYKDILDRAIVEANQYLLTGGCNCGSKLAHKHNKHTRERFLGCVDYPACKNTYSYIKFPEECQIKKASVQEVTTPVLATSLYQRY
jgi:hypothetical protein